MTVIAWDGKILAADKQNTSYGLKMVTTKIFQLPDGIVGFCGGAASAMVMLEWMREGGHHHQSDSVPAVVNNEVATGMFIRYHDRKVLQYVSGSRIPLPCAENIVAMGAGRDFALGAMHAGKSAIEAVQITCKLDVNCGMGIDSLEL